MKYKIFILLFLIPSCSESICYDKSTLRGVPLYPKWKLKGKFVKTGLNIPDPNAVYIKQNSREGYFTFIRFYSDGRAVIRNLIMNRFPEISDVNSKYGTAPGYYIVKNNLIIIESFYPTDYWGYHRRKFKIIGDNLYEDPDDDKSPYRKYKISSLENKTGSRTSNKKDASTKKKEKCIALAPNDDRPVPFNFFFDFGSGFTIGFENKKKFTPGLYYHSSGFFQIFRNFFIGPAFSFSFLENEENLTGIELSTISVELRYYHLVIPWRLKLFVFTSGGYTNSEKSIYNQEYTEVIESMANSSISIKTGIGINYIGTAKLALGMRVQYQTEFNYKNNNFRIPDRISIIANIGFFF